MKTVTDLTGRRFGRLTVVSIAEHPGRNTAWNVVCDCGQKRIVIGGNLKRGTTVSCGCVRVTPIADRLMSRIDRDSSGCWLWTGRRMKNGYATMGSGKDRKDLVHRVSWQVHHGTIPEGMMVCHKCDVRHCVNPEHLFLGTAQDNTQDMFSKGRYGRAKVAADDVPKIRAAYASGLSLAEVGRRFGITYSHVRVIVQRPHWTEAKQAAEPHPSTATAPPESAR